jgi:cytochrome c oxidase subunit 3
MNANHPYHIIPLSPWPILTSFTLLFIAGGAVMYMHNFALGIYSLIAGIIALIYCLVSWWADVIKEGLIDHAHTKEVRQGLSLGMTFFILSEIMFFFAFFFSFFHSSLFPTGILDGIWVVSEGSWPPKNIRTFDPFDIPFMNTLILLLSGTTVTWAHYELENNNQEESARALKYTILLGVFFSFMQAIEYIHAPFKFTDGVYASNFYMATGFHGVHVIIGNIFLTVSYFRIKKGHYKKGNGYLGFEFAAWYWHFVDVVWLFLFIFVYILGA